MPRWSKALQAKWKETIRKNYQLVFYYSERSRGYKFYDPMIRSIFEVGNAWFFKDVKFTGGDNVRDFVFEEESVNISKVAIDNDQTSIIDILQ